MTLSAEWQNLLAQPATPVRALAREMVPEGPGVYVWRRDGVEQYVGTAKSLRGRLWRKHLGNGISASGSSLRRNVACLLFGIPPALTGTGRQKLTREQADAVREWILGCELAWVETATESDAVALEKLLRAEWMPPLNRI